MCVQMLINQWFFVEILNEQCELPISTMSTRMHAMLNHIDSDNYIETITNRSRQWQLYIYIYRQGHKTHTCAQCHLVCQLIIGYNQLLTLNCCNSIISCINAHNPITSSGVMT